MEINFKKNDKISKLIMVVCVGVLLLVVVVPTKKNSMSYTEIENKEQTNSIEEETAYYESRLKTILENTYGANTMDVMIHMTDKTDKTDKNLFYGEAKEKLVVDGVLVVAQVKDLQAVSDITFAVCALFDLPAHKVAVMIKK